MQADQLGVTLLALLALFGVVAFAVCRIEGLAPFAPKSTKRIAASAGAYCAGRCRTTDGHCPLTGSTEQAAQCPLWRFVDADLPTTLYGSPFEQLQAT